MIGLLLPAIFIVITIHVAEPEVWTLILLSPAMKRMSSLYKSLVHPSIWSLNRKVDWHEVRLLFTSTRSHPAMQWSHSPNACLQSWDLIPCQITGATAATPATLIASESAGVQGRPAIFISTWLLAAGLPLSNVQHVTDSSQEESHMSSSVQRENKHGLLSCLGCCCCFDPDLSQNGRKCNHLSFIVWLFIWVCLLSSNFLS